MPNDSLEIIHGQETSQIAFENGGGKVNMQSGTMEILVPNFRFPLITWSGEIFRTRPDRPWDPPNLLYNGYRVFPGGKAAGAWC